MLSLSMRRAEVAKEAARRSGFEWGRFRGGARYCAYGPGQLRDAWFDGWRRGRKAGKESRMPKGAECQVTRRG